MLRILTHIRPQTYKLLPQIKTNLFPKNITAINLFNKRPITCLTNKNKIYQNIKYPTINNSIYKIPRRHFLPPHLWFFILDDKDWDDIGRGMILLIGVGIMLYICVFIYESIMYGYYCMMEKYYEYTNNKEGLEKVKECKKMYE